MILSNERHEAFCRVFAETGSVTSAALAAGYSRHLSSRGSDLLKRADVTARVRELVALRLNNSGQLEPQVVRHLGSPNDALQQIVALALGALGAGK
jgi:phage terminase small subunit